MDKRHELWISLIRDLWEERNYTEWDGIVYNYGGSASKDPFPHGATVEGAIEIFETYLRHEIPPAYTFVFGKNLHFSELARRGHRIRFLQRHPEYQELIAEVQASINESVRHIREVSIDPSIDTLLAGLLSDNSYSGNVPASKAKPPDYGFSSFPEELYMEFSKHVANSPLITSQETRQLLKIRDYLRVQSHLRTPEAKFTNIFSEQTYHRPIMGLFANPILLFMYNIDDSEIYLDMPEFNGVRGIPVWGQRSESERSSAVINSQTMEVIEQKGVRLSLYTPYIFPVTRSPVGTALLKAVEEEAAVVQALSGILPYEAKAHDIHLTVYSISPDNLDVLQKVNLGVLERRGKLNRFAPHLRLRHLVASSGFAYFLATNGFDIGKIFYELGVKLGSIHEKGYFPLFLNSSNIDIYGNPIDLEGTIGINNIDRFYKDWKLASLEFKDQDPLLGIHNIYYLETDEGTKPKILIERPGERMPKRWRELEEEVLIHGPRIAEPTSLSSPLSVAIEIDGNKNTKIMLKHIPFFIQTAGEQNKFYATIKFLEGYFDAREKQRLSSEEVYGLLTEKDLPFRILDRIRDNVPKIYLPGTIAFVGNEEHFSK